MSGGTEPWTVAVESSVVLAGGVLLAENTYEALRVIRRGDWVYKFLKPHDAFPPFTAAERLRQIHLRVAESQRHPELNPLCFLVRENCLVSRFVAGRRASPREARACQRNLLATGRGYLFDVNEENIRIDGPRAVVIDFAIDERHSDWIARNCLMEPFDALDP